MADNDLNRNTNAIPVYLINPADGSRYASGAATPVQLAFNVPIAAGGSTATKTATGGIYTWDAQFTGTGPLVLQSLGSDGTTWRNVASLNGSGTYNGEIRIGANASLRLFSTTALTAVYSSIS